MIKTGKQGVVNDFLPNPNWRQCCFCFWIGEMQIAEMRQFGNAGSHQRQTSGGSSWTAAGKPFLSSSPSTPLPALCTRCFWGKLSWLSSQKKKKCRSHGRICQHTLDVLPSPVLCFPLCWRRSHCQLWFTDDRHDPWTPPPHPRPPNTDDVCGVPRTMFVKLKSSAAEYFWRQVLYSFL